MLQNWIKGFAKHGLLKIPGKNVCSLYNAAWNIAKRLHEVDALPSDTAMEILTGLTKATNNDFTRPLKLLKDLSNQSIINLGHLKTKTALERIKTYLTQALDSYVVHVVNMRSQASLPVGIVASLVMTFGLAPSLATKNALTKPGPPTVRTRSWAQVNQAVPGEVALATCVESLASLQLAAKQFV